MAQEQRRGGGMVVPEDDRKLYHDAGFGGRVGLSNQVALLVIDVQYRTVGHQRVPIDKAMEEYPTACGNRGWMAVDALAGVLAAARQARVPVLHPHVARKTTATAGRFREKSPTLASREADAYRFVEETAPEPGELLVPKDFPSAFFATPLLTHLIELGVDSLLLTGCTTSGCVRATAVDAFSYGLRVGVVSDAVYDRTDVVHEVSLFDLDSKYADVMDSAEAIAHLTGTAA
ncbi:MAG: isochorismatase family protein [Solirubrobacteraceae bacterium]